MFYHNWSEIVVVNETHAVIQLLQSPYKNSTPKQCKKYIKNLNVTYYESNFVIRNVSVSKSDGIGNSSVARSNSNNTLHFSRSFCL